MTDAHRTKDLRCKPEDECAPGDPECVCHRTSNPQCTHIAVDVFGRGLRPEPCPYCENEHLKEEIGVLSGDVDHSIENGKKLRAEIDRLTAELATLRNEAGDSDIEWQDEYDSLEAALRSATSREASLFVAIAHGDETHRAWLKQAIEDHFAGRPVQPAVGLGRKEAMLREALAKHGRHGRDCDITLYGNDPGVIIECTCGLDDALAGTADETVREP